MKKLIVPWYAVLIIVLCCGLIFLLQFASYQNVVVYKGPCHFVEWSTKGQSLRMNVEFDNGKKGYTSDKKAFILLEPGKKLVGELQVDGNVTFAEQKEKLKG